MRVGFFLFFSASCRCVESSELNPPAAKRQQNVQTPVPTIKNVALQQTILFFSPTILHYFYCIVVSISRNTRHSYSKPKKNLSPLYSDQWRSKKIIYIKKKYQNGVYFYHNRNLLIRNVERKTTNEKYVSDSQSKGTFL